MNKELFELLKSLENYQCYIQSGSLHLTGHIEGLSRIKVKSNFIEFYQKLEWNYGKIAKSLDEFLRDCKHLDSKGQYHDDKFEFIDKTKKFINNLEVKIGDFYPFECKSYEVHYYKNVISAINIVCKNDSIIKITQIKKNESK
jgi:hypothetical protein